MESKSNFDLPMIGWAWSIAHIWSESGPRKVLSR